MKIVNWFKNDFIRIFVGSTIILLALLATVVSTYLSCIGLLDLLDELNVTYEYTETIIIIFVILLQSMVFFGSISRGLVYKFCPQHYSFIDKFVYIAFIISTLSTITFFSQFDKDDRTDAVICIIDMFPIIQNGFRDWLIEVITNMSLIYIGAIALDIMSMKFPGVGSDLIFKISTKRQIKLNEVSYLGKIILIITCFPKRFIDYLCEKFNVFEYQDSNTCIQNSDTKKTDTKNSDTNEIQKNSDTINSDTINSDTKLNTIHVFENEIQDLKDGKNEIHVSDNDNEVEYKLNTNELERPVIDECISSNEYVSDSKVEYKEEIVSNEIQDVSDTNNSNTDTNNLNTDTKLNTLNEIQNNSNTNKLNTIEIQNTKSNTKLNTDTKNEIQDLINKIDDYIIVKYVSGEKINVNELKIHFGFKKQDRTWNDKIRPNLKSASINPDNKRLTRISTNKKDKLKVMGGK